MLRLRSARTVGDSDGAVQLRHGVTVVVQRSYVGRRKRLPVHLHLVHKSGRHLPWRWGRAFASVTVGSDCGVFRWRCTTSTQIVRFDIYRKSVHIYRIALDSVADKRRGRLFDKVLGIIFRKYVIEFVVLARRVVKRRDDFTAPSTAMTISAWVAPRVFENLPYYNGESDAAGHTRLTHYVLLRRNVNHKNGNTRHDQRRQDVYNPDVHHSHADVAPARSDDRSRRDLWRSCRRTCRDWRSRARTAQCP